jgi:hypothetical protein
MDENSLVTGSIGGIKDIVWDDGLETLGLYHLHFDGREGSSGPTFPDTGYVPVFP